MTATKTATPATPSPAVGRGKGWPKTKVCDDCETKYTATGSRSTCPRCNPKIVTAVEAAEKKYKRPPATDRDA